MKFFHVHFCDIFGFRSEFFFLSYCCFAISFRSYQVQRLEQSDLFLFGKTRIPSSVWCVSWCQWEIHREKERMMIWIDWASQINVKGIEKQLTMIMWVAVCKSTSLCVDSFPNSVLQELSSAMVLPLVVCAEWKYRKKAFFFCYCCSFQNCCCLFQSHA